MYFLLAEGKEFGIPVLPEWRLAPEQFKVTSKVFLIANSVAYTLPTMFLNLSFRRVEGRTTYTPAKARGTRDDLGMQRLMEWKSGVSCS
ncbi:hypothetical protein [Paenibacillus phytorum]|uniref:hypothetical protein n=1 Tax=Paenibacillus phytorum TaxID=2654977 RepID=UPI001C11F37B|nr:hypothetical protein [Paenibacillus phytorum]